MTSPRQGSPASRSYLALLSVATGAAGLSFLPAELKCALHTRGCLHNWAHVLLFALMGALSPHHNDKRHLWWQTSAAAWAFACVIEGAQAGCQWRSLEWSDLFLDSGGLLLGLLVSYLRMTQTRSAQGC